jgi:uncharacterized protein (TIGR03437 family)
VTITGTDLLGTTGVTVDGKRVSFTALSATQLRVVVPKHPAGSANLQVTTPGGTGTASFTWVA